MKKRMMACLLSILLAFSWGALAEAPEATDAPAPAENAIFVEAGYRHSFALDANGALWGWGAGEYGRLGSGSSFSTYDMEPVELENVVEASAAGIIPCFAPPTAASTPWAAITTTANSATARAMTAACP